MYGHPGHRHGMHHGGMYGRPMYGYGYGRGFGHPYYGRGFYLRNPGMEKMTRSCYSNRKCLLGCGITCIIVGILSFIATPVLVYTTLIFAFVPLGFLGIFLIFVGCVCLQVSLAAKVTHEHAKAIDGVNKELTTMTHPDLAGSTAPNPAGHPSHTYNSAPQPTGYTPQQNAYAHPNGSGGTESQGYVEYPGAPQPAGYPPQRNGYSAHPYVSGTQSQEYVAQPNEYHVGLSESGPQPGGYPRVHRESTDPYNDPPPPYPGTSPPYPGVATMPQAYQN